jgi:flagellar biosynthesis/type III secretory pathway protein FliH
MGVRTWKHRLATVLACLAVSAPLAAHADEAQRGRDKRMLQRAPRAYQEPAFAAGYDSGFKKGLSDGAEGDRYDPVRHADYRDAESGYRTSYGARDAYRNNYRAGFRQGYEDGYREGTRSRK